MTIGQIPTTNPVSITSRPAEYVMFSDVLMLSDRKVQIRIRLKCMSLGFTTQNVCIGFVYRKQASIDSTRG